MATRGAAGQVRVLKLSQDCFIDACRLPNILGKAKGHPVVRRARADQVRGIASHPIAADVTAASSNSRPTRSGRPPILGQEP